MILSFFFQNTKRSNIRPQIIDLKNLDDSVLILQALQTSAASLTSAASAASLASTASTAIFPQKTSWYRWFDQNDPCWSFFVELIIKIPIFYWYMVPLSFEGCWGQPMLLFLKTGWWNPNAQASEIYRYLHYNLNIVFSWPPRSSKSVNMSWNIL